MLPIDEMIEQNEIQDGVNSALVRIIQVLACAVTAKLPEGNRAEFQSILQDISEDEELLNELSDNGKQAFAHVASSVAAAVKNQFNNTHG